MIPKQQHCPGIWTGESVKNLATSTNETAHDSKGMIVNSTYQRSDLLLVWNLANFEEPENKYSSIYGGPDKMEWFLRIYGPVIEGLAETNANLSV